MNYPAGTGHGDPISCIIELGDAVNKAELLNETEFVRTAANSSDVNLVHLSDGYAVLGPAQPPPDLDFQATSFGSQTSCRVLTGPCGANSTSGSRMVFPSDFNFVCNGTIAGLNMTGNFMNLLGQEPSDNETEPPLVVLVGNTIARNGFSIGFQYFNDSERLAQTPELDVSYGSAEDRHQLYWALVWWAPFSTVLTHGYTPSGMNGTLASETPVTNETAAVGVSSAMKGGSFGILSCETNISEVVGCSRTNSRNSSVNISIDILL